MRVPAYVASVLALAAVYASPAAAITIGSNDSGNCYPFNCNDSGSATGQSFDYYAIYRSGAFSGPITFNQINFFDYAPQPGPVLNGNYTIQFGVTSDPVGTASLPSLSNIGSFFSGHLGGSSTGGIFSIFGSSYTYNPADGNLVMRVVVTDQDLVPNGGGNGYFQADYQGVDVSRYYAIGAGEGVAATGALVTEFTTGAVPEPASWAMMIGGFGLIGGAMRTRSRAVRFA